MRRKRNETKPSTTAEQSERYKIVIALKRRKKKTNKQVIQRVRYSKGKKKKRTYRNREKRTIVK